MAEAEEKLNMLMGYRDEYGRRFDASQQQGITPMAYRNFQARTYKKDGEEFERLLANKLAQGEHAITRMEQLAQADETLVNGLLDDFWRHYEKRGRRGEALAVLGLSDPVDAGAIKRRYRQLAMEHHPDRGGDTAELQRLHEAMRLLQSGP